MSNNKELLVQRYASEIVQTVMMSVVMKEHPNITTDAVAAKLSMMLENFNENS